MLPTHAETLTHGTLEYEVTKEKEIRILGYSDAALADLGVVDGDNGKYKPNAPVTRGQFVGMLDKALKAME